MMTLAGHEVTGEAFTALRADWKANGESLDHPYMRLVDVPTPIVPLVTLTGTENVAPLVGGARAWDT